jgi:hypothetical protein
MSQQNLSTLQSAINAQLADNTSGAISAADVRDNLINMTDSLLFNSGSQGITGSLTATSFTGSLLGTASNATSASNANLADVATKISTTIIGGSGTLYPMVGNISQGNANLYNIPSNYSYNLSTNQLFASSISGSFTGSLSGTSSYAAQALSSSFATSSSRAAIASNVILNDGIITGTNISNINMGDGQGAINLVSNQTNVIPSLILGSSNYSNAIKIGSYANNSHTLSVEGDFLLEGNTGITISSPITDINYAGGVTNINNGVGGQIQITGTTSVTGRLSVTGGITGSFTGSLQGTASYASMALSASWAPNTGGSSFPFTGSAGISGSLVLNGTLRQGQSTQTTGDYSRAYGNSSIASGNYSHAEGNTTEAIGQYSHAEGQFNIANGNASHAEGAGTIANGSFSHAEGLGTVAQGMGQHAQGAYNISSSIAGAFILGNGSDNDNRSNLIFAAGNKVQITGSLDVNGYITGSLLGTASLSEATIGAGDPVTYPGGGEVQFKGSSGVGGVGGKTSWSSAFLWSNFGPGLTIGDPNTSYGSGAYFLATGYDSIATGDYSVSHGSSSYAQGEGTFTHGQEVTATAAYSHAEGYSTVTLGQFSHAEGYNTTATGNNSHAEGANTTSTGLSSHAEGTLTNAQGSYSHAEGQTTIALGQGSHTEGLGTVASGSFQHVQGRYNTPGDTTSLMIVGNGTFSTPSDAFKVRMSGSIVLPTTQSAAPSWTGTDGEMVFATVTGNHRFYVWMAGAWRSGSLS